MENSQKIKVAFFQRIFAHYQSGLVEELASNSKHDWTFFGDKKDPGISGIAPLPSHLRESVNFKIVNTYHFLSHFSFQPSEIIQSLIGSFDVFILEGSAYHLSSWIAMIIAKIRHKRVILYTHGWLNPDKNFLIRNTRRIYYKLADALLLYGNRARSIGLSLDFPASKLYVCYNSLDYKKMITYREQIDQEECDMLRKQLFGNQKIKIITYIGRLVKWKHIDVLFDTCDRVIKQGYTIGLLIIGDGPEKEHLKEIASNSRVKSHFTGAIYDEETLSALLSLSSATIQMNAIGLSAIHSLTYGIPVITSDDFKSHCPEVEAVIPGRTGEFFKKDDPESLVNILISIITSSDSEAQYRESCKQIVDQFYNPIKMREAFDDAVSDNSQLL